MQNRRLLWFAITGVVILSQPAWAEAPIRAASTGHPNVATATLGGKQFWADELLFHGWRIQRNAVTNHYRLLDESNTRRAWGSFEACRAALDEVKQQEKLPPMKGKAIILLHGLGRTRTSMRGLAKYLEQQEDYTVLRFSYPSGLAEVEQHAKSLERVLSHLEGIDEIHFVAHSLGNLVIRRYFYDRQQAMGPGYDKRIRRFVMLAPPNHGSRLAESLGQNDFTGALIGTPGRELAENWDELSKTLATPPCEFAVIAGGRSDDKGYNPLLAGDDDLVVTVSETRLKGAKDFLLVPVIHAVIMDDKIVQEATLRFLQRGYFVAEDRRQTIE